MRSYGYRVCGKNQQSALSVYQSLRSCLRLHLRKHSGLERRLQRLGVWGERTAIAAILFGFYGVVKAVRKAPLQASTNRMLMLGLIGIQRRSGAVVRRWRAAAFLSTAVAISRARQDFLSTSCQATIPQCRCLRRDPASGPRSLSR